MADRPIIFSAGMIHALLDGRKSQTRRVISPRNTLFNGGRWPKGLFDRCLWGGAWVDPGPSPVGNPGPYLKVWWPYDDDENLVARVYPCVQPGDHLWVRESWSPWADARSASAAQCIEGSSDPCIWRADYTPGADSDAMGGAGWRSPIHMPRWASRLTLVVSDVRVQRVQDINRGDAMGEGCPFPNMAAGPDPREWFRAIWNSIHGPEAWDRNDWVTALTFTVHRCNIDQMETTDE